MLNKLISASGLLAATVAFVAFVAIAVGVWFVAAELSRRAERLLGQADAALDRAQPIARRVGEAIGTAETEVKAAHEPAPRDSGVASKRLHRSSLKETPGRVAGAARTVDSLSDLLIVAQVALDAMQDHAGEMPANGHDLSALRKNLSDSTAALQKVDAILSATHANQAIAAEETSKIEQALAETRGVLEQVESKLAAARNQVTKLREQIPLRLRYGTWVIFALSLMGAIGQVALVRWILNSRRSLDRVAG